MQTKEQYDNKQDWSWLDSLGSETVDSEVMRKPSIRMYTYAEVLRKPCIHFEN